MPPITTISPELLKSRHRLTAQQINALFGRRIMAETIEEKIVVLELVNEFLVITDALRSDGISFIPLKGPLLSYRIYNDATFRHFRDLDILIDQRSIDRSIEILENSGYLLHEQGWSENRLTRKVWIDNHHHFTLEHPEKQVIIELHWHLLGNFGINLSNVKTLVQKNQSEVEFGGRHFKVLSNEMELLYMIIHGSLHFWGRLKWLYDVNSFNKNSTINYKKFKELTNGLNAGRLVALFNVIGKEYFPDIQIIDGFNTVPKYMIRYSLKRIKEEDYKNPENIKTIIQGLRFTIMSFTGIRFKSRSFKSYFLSSLFFGRIGSFLKKINLGRNS